MMHRTTKGPRFALKSAVKNSTSAKSDHNNHLRNMNLFIGSLFLILMGIPIIYAWDYRDLILVDHDLFRC